MKRVFIGYKCDSLPDLVFATDRIKATLKDASVKWATPLYWHITSHFIGQVTNSKISMLKKIINEVAGNSIPFSVSIKEIGFFPSPDRPRILWAGTNPAEELAKLYDETGNLLQQGGFEIDNRSYAPHITLARIKRCNDTYITKQIANDFKNHIFGTVNINEIILYESRLFLKGEKYIPIYKAEML